MTKTHFIAYEGASALCRSKGLRGSANVHRVDCLNCKGKPEFERAVEAWKVREEARIEANEPRHVHNSWDYKVLINCKECGHDLFKEAGGSLFYNYHRCAKCGHTESTPTETYMCM